MLKVLVWQVSKDTSFKDKAIKILEEQHNGIEIVGEAVNENIAKVDGGGQYDVLLVVGAKKVGMSKVTENAHKLNLPEEKLLGDWIVIIPGFALEKYRQLQRSRLSIFSVNCFGACVSNLFGLPFRSPFVNLFLSSEDFLKFLQAPRDYIEAEPTFKKFYEWRVAFPVLALKDISLNMKHYKKPDEAITKWNERKQRINWDNLLVVSFAENKKLLEQFEALPYEKKACFTLFKSNLKSAWYINPEIEKKTIHFKDSTNNLRARLDNFGWGKIFYYDLFDMLLYGRKIPLIDIG